MYQLIEPYSGGSETEKKESTEHKLSLQGRQMEKVEAGVGPTFALCSTFPGNESKDIKNIYIDCKPQTFLSFLDIRHGSAKILKKFSFQNKVCAIGGCCNCTSGLFGEESTDNLI